MKNINNTLADIQLNQTVEQLEQLLFCDLVMTYNDYASAMSYELIHDNDEENINTLFETPYEAAQAVVYGKYNPIDDYVTLDGYSNVISFSYHPIQDDNCPIDISEIAQWLINEDKLSEYDITVTTLDDMLASIEDNISDDENLLKTAINYLGVSTMYKGNDKLTDYNQYLIDSVMDEIKYTDFETIKGVIDRLGINYE